MANTIIYVQEHGYNTQTELKDAFPNLKTVRSCNKSAYGNECRFENINRQIHYTGQYFAQKALYTEFLKAKTKADSERNTPLKFKHMKKPVTG